MAVLKIRNNADDGWIELGGVGTVYQSDSAPATPHAGQMWLDTDATFNAPTYIQDLDGDTKVQTEESSDEDIIRMDIAGSEVLVLDSTTLSHTGAGGIATIAATPVVKWINTAAGSGSDFCQIYFSSTYRFTAAWKDIPTSVWTYMWQFENDGSLVLAQNPWVLDEDDFVSNSATHVCTQQSIKAYVRDNTWRYWGGAALTGDTEWTYSGVFTTDYVGWRYIFSSVTSDTANCPLIVQVQSGDTTWYTAGYTGMGQLLNAAGTTMSTGFMAISAGYHDAAGSGYGIYEMYKNTPSQGRINFQGSYHVTVGATVYHGRGSGWINAGAAGVTGIRIKLYVGGAAWDGGVAYLYVQKRALVS